MPSRAALRVPGRPARGVTRWLARPPALIAGAPSRHMSDVKFRSAAGAYLLYGIVYWVGGVYLALHGVGVRGEMARVGIAWIVAGTVLVLVIPYLLHRPRPWFERWVLSRRDFARVLALFMGLRALKVGQVAIRPETAIVSLPWAGTVTFRFGAAVFFVVTVLALAFVGRAAWAREGSGA